MTDPNQPAAELPRGRFPVGCAVSVDLAGPTGSHLDGGRYVDGWVADVPAPDGYLFVKPDSDRQAMISVNPAVDNVTITAGPVAVRWEAVSRVEGSAAGAEQTPRRQVEQLLQAVTAEWADPTQREDDLRRLAEAIGRAYPVGGPVQVA